MAPGRVLTCAHVVPPGRGAVTVTWRKIPSEATVVQRLPAEGEGDPHPYPDLALLAVDCPDHPCVSLDPHWPELGPPQDTFRTSGFAFPFDPAAPPQLTPMTFTYEGVLREEGGARLQLKDGQVLRGMSGAPLLNERSWQIAGMLTTTRDGAQDLGGWAVSAPELLVLVPRICMESSAFHAANPRWEAATPWTRTPSHAQLVAAGLYVWTASDFWMGTVETDDDGDVAAVEPGELVDVALVRQGRLPNLQKGFEDLARVFDTWLTPAHPRKRGPERLRVLWLEGDPGAQRSRALLACLARAQRGRRQVYDAGARLDAAVGGLTLSVHAAGDGPPPLIAVDLPGGQAADSWTAVAGAMANARKRHLPAGSDPYPRMIVAGTAEQGQSLHDACGTLVEIEPVDVRGRHGQRPYSFHGMSGLESATLSREHVYNKGLPVTARRLFGRERELDVLTEAWRSRRIRVLSVVAYGGTGKSALVNRWLTDMRDCDYLGASRVYAWSFYSQGTKETLVSADPFVNHALRWLGDTSAASLNPWSKGHRLASLIKRHDFLLVLDGLEPLQHPLSAPDVGGQFTDDSISALLEELARPSRRGEPDRQGLCLITTRVPLTDLRSFQAARRGGTGTVAQLDLENLDDKDATDLLKHLVQRADGARPAGSPGPDFRDLQHAVRRVGNHALAVTLLGNYLWEVHQGDLAGRFDLKGLPVGVREGGQARRVMDSYIRWFERDQRWDELAVLLIMGLFDRPAYPEAIAALLADRHLASFRAGLDRVGGERWDRCVGALRGMGLLNSESQGLPGTVDAHPLVREHFRDELLKRGADAWRQGNRTLFRYYRHHAARQPRTSRGMTPLYAAVTHGCAAGLHQEVFDRILMPRVWRDRRTNYSTRRLGMTGSDLVALSNYFRHRQWRELQDLPLSPRTRVLVRTNAGVRLRQLGRLQEARQCFDAVVAEIDPDTAAPEELEDASYAAAQYCELLVIAGKLTGAPGERDVALVTGRLAVEYSDRGDDAYFSMHARSSLAEVHFMLGDLDRAGALFEEARAVERLRHPSPGFLYSQSLYRYGCYLIETGRAQQVLDDQRSDPDWGTNGRDSSLLSRAIRLVIIGAARRALIEAGRRTPEFLEETERILHDSISEFRTAGYPDYIVRGLLERARFYRARHETEDYVRALEDLDKATYEAGRGHMELLYADVLLERCACYLQFIQTMTSPERSAVAPRIARDLRASSDLVERFAYGRRREMSAALGADATGHDVVRRAMERA